MFWNKKDEKDMLPDLPQDNKKISLKLPPADLSNIKSFNLKTPPTPEKDEEDEEVFEKHDLPSFPDSPMQRGFSQTAIKEAVNEDHLALPKLPEKPIKTIEIEDWSSKSEHSEMPIPPKKIKQEYSPSTNPVITRPYVAESRKEIYVKLDKFKNGKKALREIGEKVEEVDRLLKKIRETKLREEQELVAWEKDVATIKARLHEVTENIFEKIE